MAGFAAQKKAEACHRPSDLALSRSLLHVIYLIALPIFPQAVAKVQAQQAAAAQQQVWGAGGG